MTLPAPKNVLRIAMNFCLVGWGGSAIYQVSHVGPGYYGTGLTHELIIFFFVGLLAFALFFLEYHFVERISKRELNRELGYLQSLSCFLIFIFGILALCYSYSWKVDSVNAAFPDYVLEFILAFGHLVFLGNVAWTYIQERSAS